MRRYIHLADDHSDNRGSHLLPRRITLNDNFQHHKLGLWYVAYPSQCELKHRDKPDKLLSPVTICRYGCYQVLIKRQHYETVHDSRNQRIIRQVGKHSMPDTQACRLVNVEVEKEKQGKDEEKSAFG